MKKFSVILMAVIASIAMAMPSQARLLRVGPRVGVDVNSLHFNTDMFSKENRAGFTGGLQFEVNLPLGIGFDASVMYARRTIGGKFTDGTTTIQNQNQDYINIPINFKWGLGVPLVGKIISPYIFTGPDFAFRVSKEAVVDAFKNRDVDVAWDFGAGIQLFSHLQVSATYGLGITKWTKMAGVTGKGDTGRTNNWTVTAAWLF